MAKSDEIQVLKLSDITIDWSKNPRARPSDSEVKSLADDIKQRGQLSPVMVGRDKSGALHLVYGYRRALAVQVAGIDKVRAQVVDLPSELERYKLAVVENEQRRDLTGYERAVTYAALESKGMKAEEIASLCDKSRSLVTNALTFLRRFEGGHWPEELRALWEKDQVGTHALEHLGANATAEEIQALIDKGNKIATAQTGNGPKEGGEAPAKIKTRKPAAVQGAISALIARMQEPDGEVPTDWCYAAALVLAGHTREEGWIRRVLSEAVEYLDKATAGVMVEGADIARRWLASQAKNPKIVYVSGKASVQIFPEIQPAAKDDEDDSAPAIAKPKTKAERPAAQA